MSDQTAATAEPTGDLNVAKSMIGDAFSFLEEKVSTATGKDLVTKTETQQEPEQTNQRSSEAAQQQVEALKAVEGAETGSEGVENTQEGEDVSDIPEGDSATPKAKAKWGEVKKKATSYDKIFPEYENLKKEVETLRKGEGIPEFQTIKQQLAEAEKRAADLQAREEETERKALMLDVKNSKKYEQAVKQPYYKLIGDIEYLAKENSLNADKLADAVLSNNKQGIQEMIGELDEYTRTQTWDLLRNFQTIQRAKADIEENAKGAYEAYTREEQANMEKQSKQILESRGAEFDKLRGNIEGLIKDFPDESKPNFEDIRKTALNIESAPEHHKVMASMAAHILPSALDLIKTYGAELEALKKENSSLRNGAPRANNGAAPAANQQRKETTVNTSTDLAGDIFSKLERLGR